MTSPRRVSSIGCSNESTGDSTVWHDLRSSDVAYDSWLAALDDGILALFKRVEDERIGPRVLGEDEDEDPVG